MEFIFKKLYARVFINNILNCKELRKEFIRPHIHLISNKQIL